jgi:hypothetical protein
MSPTHQKPRQRERPKTRIGAEKFQDSSQAIVVISAHREVTTVLPEHQILPRPRSLPVDSMLSSQKLPLKYLLLKSNPYSLHDQLLNVKQAFGHHYLVVGRLMQRQLKAKILLSLHR